MKQSIDFSWLWYWCINWCVNCQVGDVSIFVLLRVSSGIEGECKDVEERGD